MDLKAIATKWQARWDKEGVFKAEADERQKYYIAIVYPYMNGLLHLGHLFTYMTSEVLGRYKRMQGFNVLYKFGFHCTGTPIVAAAQRVKEKEAKQLEALKKMGIPERELAKFAEAEHWINYFPKETLKDIKRMGFGIDERYTFRTTSINPAYDAFIRWQFNKLKEKGYVKKGKHPVVWCPKCNAPTGDHARAEGEGEVPQEFLLFKHRLDDGRYLISATLRPDTVLGITNLFVGPEIEYIEAEVNKERWILGENCLKGLQEQGFLAKVLRKIKGKELIGKKTLEFDGNKVLVLPAEFLDPKFGTGLVHSVPSDSADDLIALWELQKDKESCLKYGLNFEEVKKIKPIPILKTPGYGEIAAEVMLKKYGVKSQKEREKLEEIKKELYKLSHHTATFNEKYKKIFSKNLEGKRVEEGKESIKKELVEKGFAAPYHELSGKVVCRCLTECIVKLVSDQWFIEYNDPAWKKITHECLKGMKIHPEQLRKQFGYVIDWLNHWACTREFGLGTRLPWDEKWMIESLSDSTIQMAYGTISKYLEHPREYGFKLDKLNDEFFDYVFLGKGTAEKVWKSTKIAKEMIEQMRKDFEYWYPFDFRNSAKDLLQNHLAFCLFNHTALFPRRYWPKSFLINGRIMVNNEKMSKSKGNFFTMRELYEKSSPDAVRLTAANGGEGADDANYDMGFLETAEKKLEEIHNFIKENYGKGREEHKLIDEWFESRINEEIRETTDSFEKMMFKTALQHCLMEMQKNLRWYERRTGGRLNKKLVKLFVESQLKMLAPYAPHFCEESWELIGGGGFISQALWPKYDSKKIKPELDISEEILKNNLYDIREVLKLAKVEKPKLIKLFVAEKWKYGLVEQMKGLLAKTRNQGEIMKSLMEGELRQYGKEISRLVPMLMREPGRMPAGKLSQEKELMMLEESKGLIEEEFGCPMEIILADKSEEAKAKSAMPGKVGVLVE